MELTAGLIVQKPRMDEIWRILALIKPISLVKPSWAAFSRAFHPSWRHREQFRILTRDTLDLENSFDQDIKQFHT